MKKLFFLQTIIIAFFIHISSFAQTTITVDNLNPRTDTDGNIIDVHDGRVIRFGDRFYWYGTSYKNTTGFVRTNRYYSYSSPDMMSWKKEGPLLDNQPSGVYYRPHVIYNKKTQKYVLWYNWYPELWDGKFGVAVSDKPMGPFTIVNTDVKVARSHLGVGDFGLFVDDDDQAYLIYNTIQGHQNSVERLSSDYLSSSMENGGFIARHAEAGAMFKRNDIYYLLTDYTCCFCTQGSGARVYVSDNPLTGYQLRNNINRNPGTPAPVLVDGRMTPSQYQVIKRKDDNSFISIDIWFSNIAEVDSVVIYYFTGNRSGMCGDTIAERVHPKIITPEFDVMQQKNLEYTSVGQLNQFITNTSIFNIVSYNFEPTNSISLRIKPKTKNHHEEVFIAEVKLYRKGRNIKHDDPNLQAFLGDTSPLLGRPIIPAQQTHIMELETVSGVEFLWMGDLWGSASDNIKGHDYQYWGAPLKFDEYGNILPMKWENDWQAIIKTSKPR